MRNVARTALCLVIVYALTITIIEAKINQPTGQTFPIETT